MPPTPTEALYLNDSFLYNNTTEVISSTRISSLPEDEQRLVKNVPLENTFALITKSTVFYPQGGGQPSDTGVILPSNIIPPTSPSISNESTEGQGPKQSERREDEFDTPFEVLLVRKNSSGTILHFGRFSTSPALQHSTQHPELELGLPAGKSVSLRVNEAKRTYHSRLHTAGHILGLAMRMLEPVLGVHKKTKANHFPNEASLEFEGLLYNEHKDVIQGKLDEIVAMDLPVKISWRGEEEVERRKGELNMVEGREVEDVGDGSGRLRIAEIGDLDANPCGGTHVERTGDVGRVKVRKISRVKGVTRVSYEVEEVL